MTVGGVLLGIFISIFAVIIGICCIFKITDGDNIAIGIIGLILSIICLIGVWVGLVWYYNSTAAGQRAMKTQKSEFGDGIPREITVYDMQGDVLEHYEGKFDIDFSSDQSGERIVFDDEVQVSETPSEQVQTPDMTAYATKDDLDKMKEELKKQNEKVKEVADNAKKAVTDKANEIKEDIIIASINEEFNTNQCIKDIILKYIQKLLK